MHMSGSNIISGRRNTRTKRIKEFLRIVGILLVPIGSLMLIMCIVLMYHDSTLDEKYDRTEHIYTVISAADPYGLGTVAIYQYNGVDYPYKMPIYYRLFISRSQIKDIYVDPDAPDHAYIKAGVTAYMPRCVLSLALIFFGIVIMEVSGDIKKKLVDKGRGVQIYASVVSIENTGIIIDGKTSYCITAMWEDTDNIRHSCESELLSFDPSQYIEVGEHIRVYVDPNNYNKYYMCAIELQSGQNSTMEESNSDKGQQGFMPSVMSAPSRKGKAKFRAAGILVVLSGVTILGTCASFVYNNRTLKSCDKFEARVIGIHGVTDANGFHPNRTCVQYHDGQSTGGAMLPKYCNLFMKTGQTVEIYVDPDQPYLAYVKINSAVCVMLGIFGTALTAFGISLLIKAGSDLKKKLIDKGRGELVYASVVSIGCTKPKARSMVTYHIMAIWDDMNGVRHSYRSEELYFDPSQYIEVGELIKIYVDPNNYNIYYVCAQELQQNKVQ